MTAPLAELYPAYSQPNFYPIEPLQELEVPVVITVPEMASDEFTRHRTARFIGEVMMAKAVESAEELKLEKPIESLRDAIHWAAKGDTDGFNMVGANVGTDVIERTIKTGHVMDPIKLEVTSEGTIIQHNQTAESVYANSLQLAAGNRVMRTRVEAETRNKFRIEHLRREGLLEDYNFVVFSLAEDIPDIFFTETMSCSIQVTSAMDTDLQLESAFVAGIAEPEAERHDLDTITAIGNILGVDFSGKTPAEILDMPLLVHKSLMPNGVINLVELWDKAAGGDKFFGENKLAPSGYLEYLDYCRKRTATFQPKIDIIRRQLIAEASQIKTRLQAIERLHELSEEQMVEKAVEDHSIDARVFGPKAAASIEKARIALVAGNPEAAYRHTLVAKRFADSKSCPWVKKQKLNGQIDGITDLGEIEAETDAEADSEEDDEFGSLTFECTNGHINTRPRHQKITQCHVKGCKDSVGC